MGGERPVNDFEGWESLSARVDEMFVVSDLAIHALYSKIMESKRNDEPTSRIARSDSLELPS